MTSHSDHIKKSPIASNFANCAIILTCLHLLLGLLACREHPRQTTPQPYSPPDLKQCTRIEVRYLPSTLEFLYVNRQEQDLLLTTEERQYLESLETIVVDDPERIKALANDLSSGLYRDRGANFMYFEAPRADIICYHNNERIASYKDYFSEIRTEGGHWFHLNRRSSTMSTLTPELRPFSVRASCSRHLSDLHSTLRLFLDGDGKEYSASQWCDAIVQVNRDGGISEKETMGPFKCPNAGEGKCHYALNPDCKPNSPLDTVHLFETKAGWNQHGGPELFTFDNHDPKGGCVLLNDGTVNFIRTKEELQQLRWK